MRILIVGATGLVGRNVLAQALSDNRIRQVIAPTRRLLKSHPKLANPLIDFSLLPDEAEWWSVEGAICTLGTTRAKAGSSAVFRAVDHGYSLAVAKMVRSRGALRFALTSATGADARSRFLYPRTKGELEADVAALGFPSFTVVRPGLIGGEREEFRIAEYIATPLVRRLGSLLPPRYRINPAERIAETLLEAAIAGQPGNHVVEADRLL